VRPVNAVTAQWYEDGGRSRRLLGERRKPRGLLVPFVRAPQRIAS
jgi:hypothetical protein